MDIEPGDYIWPKNKSLHKKVYAIESISTFRNRDREENTVRLDDGRELAMAVLRRDYEKVNVEPADA